MIFDVHFPRCLISSTRNSKIVILETKKNEIRENMISRDRVSPYYHFAKGIKGNGLYSSEKSCARSQSHAPQNGTKTSDLL